MRYAWAIALLLVASTVSAYSYTGICFLDAILRGLDSLSSRVSETVNPTTTTTSTSTTSTTTTTTTTTFTIPSTTTSTTTTSTTTTTIPGKCASEADCPEKTVTYTCDQDNNIIISTTNYICFGAGTPEADCKGRTVSRTHLPCNNVGKCKKGLDYCVNQ